MTKGSEGKGSNSAGYSSQKITRSQTGVSVATQALDVHVSVPGSGLTAVSGAALAAPALSYNPSVSTHSPVMTTTTITSSTNTHTRTDPCTSADREHLSSGVSLSSDSESGFRMFEDAGKRQSLLLQDSQMLVSLLKPVGFETTGTNHHTNIGVQGLGPRQLVWRSHLR